LRVRDHAAACWLLYAEKLSLSQALETVCVDAERRFWP